MDVLRQGRGAHGEKFSAERVSGPLWLLEAAGWAVSASRAIQYICDLE